MATDFRGGESFSIRKSISAEQLLEKCEEKSHQADFPGNLVMPHFSLLKLGNLWLPGMHLHYRITDDEKM